MQLFEEFAREFKSHSNPDEAPQMEKYMKGKFPYLGIKRPMRQDVLKPYGKAIQTVEELFDFVHGLWELEEREYQYAAMDVLQNKLRLLDSTHLPLIKSLIRSKAWWDTVDRLAESIAGPAYKKDIESKQIIFSWKDDDFLWLERSAIIFQLKYREATNVEMLSEAIKQFANSKEFFHQKAIGWALRNYSKTDPDWVRSFIENNELKPLSIREGSKYI